MNFTDEEIKEITSAWFDVYWNKEYQHLRIQIIIEMFDKLHNRSRLTIRKINKNWTDFKCEFYDYDNKAKLEKILMDIKHK